MSLDSGRRDRLIVIEQKAAQKNDYNEDIETWSEAFKLWASVYFGSGQEQREAAQSQGVQAASFEVLRSTRTRAITISGHRIRFQDAPWDIQAIAEIGANEGLRLSAIRAVE